MNGYEANIKRIQIYTDVVISEIGADWIIGVKSKTPYDHKYILF